MSEPKVHIAFRYHVNYYHSYRGDSLDEQGIGKDIRIIRGILDDLDRLNDENIPVRGTWDIENYYSLEKMMREHSPELIERIQKRVKSDRDEIELMSYNNGIVAACTEAEFNTQINLSRTNDEGSGFDDLFSKWEPILRPQECMFTPSFLRLYPKAGIPTVSMYYSAVPFNSFGCFVPPMDFTKRYNPLNLKTDGYEENMILIPAYNHGDIADRWASIRSWIKKIRRRQMRLEKPIDVLLLIDMDGDDEFWAGEDIPLIPRIFPSFDGFYRMIHSITNLPYLQFTTPGEYLKDHQTMGEITVNQDTADGSFDGYSSWAEKWENTRLWSEIQKSRDMEEYANWFAYETPMGNLRELMDQGMRARLLAMSTTHFGMASPVMNKDRLQDGFRWAKMANDFYRKALNLARTGHQDNTNSGLLLPSQAVKGDFSGMARLPGGEFTYLRIRTGEQITRQASLKGHGLEMADVVNDSTRLHFKKDRVQITAKGVSWEMMFPRVKYNSKMRSAVVNTEAAVSDNISTELPGFTGWRIEGRIEIDFSTVGTWQMSLCYLPGEEHIYIDMSYQLPKTPDKGYNKAKALRLNRIWDTRWQEFMPAEISPLFTATMAEPHRVIKHNFFEDVSSYELNYGSFSKNRNVDSLNNHITNAWVGISNGHEGLLLTQHTGKDNNFAFCPMRFSNHRGRQQVQLNPFGTYYGKQLRYPTAVTGLGRKMAILMADQFDSYAPSYNGKSGSFSLMISPFKGSRPSEDLQNRALLYAAAPMKL